MRDGRKRDAGKKRFRIALHAFSCEAEFFGGFHEPVYAGAFSVSAGKPAEPRNGHLQSVVSGDRCQTRRAAVHFILLTYADVSHDFRYLLKMK